MQSLYGRVTFVEIKYDHIEKSLGGCVKFVCVVCSGRSRIFPRGVRQLPKLLLFFQIFAENCMKMKEFGPPRGGVPGPLLDPPMLWYGQKRPNILK